MFMFAAKETVKINMCTFQTWNGSSFNVTCTLTRLKPALAATLKDTSRVQFCLHRAIGLSNFLRSTE